MSGIRTGTALADDQPEQPVAARRRADPRALLAASCRSSMNCSMRPSVVDDAEGGVLGADELADAVDDQLEDAVERQHARDASGRQVEGVDEVEQIRRGQARRPKRVLLLGRLEVGHEREPSGVRPPPFCRPARDEGPEVTTAATPAAARLTHYGNADRPQRPPTLRNRPARLADGPAGRGARRPHSRVPVAARVPARSGDRRWRSRRGNDRGVHAGRRPRLDLRPGDRGRPPERPPRRARARARPRAATPSRRARRPRPRHRRRPRPGPARRSRPAGPSTTSTPGTSSAATSATWRRRSRTSIRAAVFAKLAEILGVADNYPELQQKPSFVQVPQLVLTTSLQPLSPKVDERGQGLRPDDRRDRASRSTR